MKGAGKQQTTDPPGASTLHLMIVTSYLQHLVNVVQRLVRWFVITKPAYFYTEILRPFGALIKHCLYIVFGGNFNELVHQIR